MSEYLFVYLDESGDLGFNFDNKGTPRYFIITLLVCDNKRTVHQISQVVKRTLKNKLQSKKARPIELKGAETKLSVKKYFYHNMARLKNWHLYAIILDKYKLNNHLKT